jgi:alginate O-acetyltransferase complex protein AlgJ
VNKSNSWQKGYSIFFVTIFFVILLVQIFIPNFSLKAISEGYLWRKDLIKDYFNFKYNLGDRVYSRAVIGKDGWLFYTGDMSIQDYQKTAPANVGNLNRFMTIFNSYNEQISQYGGTFLIVIVPDKSTVYPQYIPDEIPVIGQTSSLDRLVERLQKDGRFHFLDLRTTLKQGSVTSQNYYKTDSHWNCGGAYSAYKEIISKLASLHLSLQAYSPDDFRMIPSQSSLLDVPSSMGLDLKESSMNAIPKFDSHLSISAELSGENIGKSLRVVVNPGKDSPSLMVFHDSFYPACLNSFVEPTFGSTISLHYGDASLSDQLHLVEREKPDIVILEFVERQMDFLARHLSK